MVSKRESVIAVHKRLTRSLLGLVAHDGTYNRIFISDNTISCALRVALGLSSLVLCFSLGVLFFSRILPRSRASQVTNLHA